MASCFAFLHKSKSRARSEPMPAYVARSEAQNECCDAACAIPYTAHESIKEACDTFLPSYDTIYPKSDALKTLQEKVDDLSPSLRDVSLKMHDNFEIGWVEYKTSKLLSDYIETHGFKVNRSAYGTETGFEAIFKNGKGGRTIGVRIVGTKEALA